MNTAIHEETSHHRFVVRHNDYDKCDEIIDKTLGEAFFNFTLKDAARLLNACCVPILKPGEHYAGIIMGKDGEPSHHLILLPDAANKVNWTNAKEWAAKSGGDLPTRREQSLLFANLKEQFEEAYYWSSEQRAATSDYAWCQDFNNGYLDYYNKLCELRARAVRRLEIL